MELNREEVTCGCCPLSAVKLALGLLLVSGFTAGSRINGGSSMRQRSGRSILLLPSISSVPRLFVCFMLRFVCLNRSYFSFIFFSLVFTGVFSAILQDRLVGNGHGIAR